MSFPTLYLIRAELEDSYIILLLRLCQKNGGKKTMGVNKDVSTVIDEVGITGISTIGTAIGMEYLTGEVEKGAVDAYASAATVEDRKKTKSALVTTKAIASVAKIVGGLGAGFVTAKYVKNAKLKKVGYGFGIGCMLSGVLEAISTYTLSTVTASTGFVLKGSSPLPGRMMKALPMRGALSTGYTNFRPMQNRPIQNIPIENVTQGLEILPRD